MEAWDKEERRAVRSRSAWIVVSTRRYRCRGQRCPGNGAGLPLAEWVRGLTPVDEREERVQDPNDIFLPSESELGASPFPGGRLIAVPMASVKLEEVKWSWRGWIPRGKLTVLDGDPGLGKSLLTIDLAARVSVGAPMPIETERCGDPRAVFLLSAEDDPADTIRPRLEAAGADLSRVHIVSVPNGEHHLPELPADISEIKRLVADHKVALVVIDPLMAYLEATVNAHRDQDVRRVLAQLAAIGRQTGAAILLVRHLNKGSGNGSSALYRGGGSIGIVGAARSGLLVAKDPSDPSARVLAVVKSNLAQSPQALRFRIGADEGGAPHVEWIGPCDSQADDLVRPPDEASRLEEAQRFLREHLAAGAIPAREMQRSAKGAGIAEATLNRAKDVLGVRSAKVGPRWMWTLPEPAPPTIPPVPP
jgi:hypothetical protein